MSNSMAKSASAASGRRRRKKLVRPAVQLELFPGYIHANWEELLAASNRVIEERGGKYEP